MAEDLEEVRSVLFRTLRNLSSKEKPDPIDLHLAKIICGVAQTIINSASAEIRAMNAAAIAEGNGGTFFRGKSLPSASPATATRLSGKPAALPPSRVVDPLAQVKSAPPDPEERPRAHAKANGHG